MFEAIKNTPGIKEIEAHTSSMPVKASKNVKSPHLQKKETTKKAEVNEEVKNEQPNISEALLVGLETDLNLIHNVGLQFSLHKETGRTMVKVVNKDTNELIREIPSEEVLNLAAKLDEMIGIIFDEKV